MTFGKLLETHRQKSGLTKTELARRIGVTMPYIVDIEKGKKKPPTYATCQKLITALELTENEKLEFLKAALLERRGKKEDGFYSLIHRQKEIDSVKEARPSYIADKQTAGISVPVVTPSKLRKGPPFEVLPGVFVTLPLQDVSDHYAMTLETATTTDTPFDQNDIIVFNPDTEDIQQGDYVLIKLKTNDIHIKQCRKISEDSRITLYPDNIIFSKKTNGQPVVLLGKITYAIKKY